MLCTQKRLTQRRSTHREAAASPSPTPSLLVDGAAGIGGGPVVRLCAQRLVNDGTRAPIETRRTITTPRMTGSTDRSGSGSIIRTHTNLNRTHQGDHRTQSDVAGGDLSARRTPLIVFTLSIAPETATLVPQAIRRDPRKLPSYCVRQRRHFGAGPDIMPDAAADAASVDRPSRNTRFCCHRSASAGDTMDFCIRGREISSVKKVAEVEPAEAGPCRSIDNDSWGRRRYDDEECERMDCDRIDTLLMLNLDGYEMDRFGHLPGDSRTPTPSVEHWRGVGSGGGGKYDSKLFLPNDEGQVRAAPKRDPSPNTEKVIRIVFNDRP